MGAAAPGTRMFALRQGAYPDSDLDDSDADDNVPPPPIPDASWTKPIRNAADNDSDGD